MVKILILTHGTLAQSLLDTSRTITGRRPNMCNLQALSLDWNEPLDVLRSQLTKAIADTDEGDGVLVLTDLYGDTPSNLAATLVSPGEVEVVTGVNLPMVLRLSCIEESTLPLGELATWIQEKGKRAIRCTVDSAVQAKATSR